MILYESKFKFILFILNISILFYASNVIEDNFNILFLIVKILILEMALLY